MSWKTQTIDHEIRIQLGLSMNDYACLDYIYRTQTSPLYGGKNGGWCDTPLSKIGEFFGLSKGALSNIFKSMVEKELLEIDGKKRRTTEKWWVVYEPNSVQKVNDAPEPSTAKRSENERNRSESERHTVVINNKESLIGANATKQPTFEEKIEAEKKKRKGEFKNLLEPFLEKYDKGMLNDFYSYWTESNYGKKKMRFENEQFFDHSKRLATWFKRSKENVKPKDETPIYTLPKSLRAQNGAMPQMFSEAAQKMKI